MLETFVPLQIKTSGASIHVLKAGSGELLLLLHGYPQTHMMWHKIAPRLADSFTVVLADLRGYGDSSKPKEEPDHATYSKRAMAQDEADLQQKVRCPLLVLWGANGFIGRKYDILAIWRERAEMVRGYAIPAGHFLAEEAPEETYNALQLFFSQR
jgi:pimeloyl-ACP methyl ester carboxylesterase